jgi:hypothetical protein
MDEPPVKEAQANVAGWTQPGSALHPFFPPLLSSPLSQVIHEDGEDGHHGKGAPGPAKVVDAMDIRMWFRGSAVWLWSCLGYIAGRGPGAMLSHGADTSH